LKDFFSEFYIDIEMERRNINEAVAEAEGRAQDFSPSERVVYVKTMIAHVEELQKTGKRLDEIKVEVPEFIEKYKNLFEMITQEGGYDKQNLKTMLVLLEKMDKGLSQHQASVIIGKKLSDKYIHVDDVQQ
jgi:hypothetical protein